MKIKPFIFTFAMAVFAKGLFPLYATDPSTKNYSLTAKFTPTKENKEIFSFKGDVRDIDTNELLFSPTIITKANEHAKAEVSRGEISYLFEVFIDKNGKTGSFDFTAKKCSKIISQQKTTISIQ